MNESIRVEARETIWWWEAMDACELELGNDPRSSYWSKECAEQGTVIVVPGEFWRIHGAQLREFEVEAVEILADALGIEEVGVVCTPTRLFGLVPLSCDPGEEVLIARLATGRAEFELLRTIGRAARRHARSTREAEIEDQNQTR